MISDVGDIAKPRFALPWPVGVRFMVVIVSPIVLFLTVSLVKTIAAGDVMGTARFVAILCSPIIVYVVLRWPYVFPYSFYVLLTPFDLLLAVKGTGTITRVLGALATVAILFACVRKKRFEPPPMSLLFLGAYFAFGIASFFWAVDVPAASTALQSLTSLMAMYAILSISPITERELRYICACIIVGGVASSVFGIYVFHHAPQSTADPGRLSLNFDNDHQMDPNFFANALLAPFALTLVALAHSRSPLRIASALGAIGILGTGIIISQSREAQLAIVVIVLMLAWASRRRVLSMLLLVPPLIIVPLTVPSIVARMSTAATTGGAGRVSIWQVGWQSFLQRPIFGWGAGGAVESYDRNFLLVFQRYNAGWTRPPHNTYLNVAIEFGLIGLTLGAIALFSIVRQYSGIRRGDSTYDLKVGLMASLAGLLLVSNFVDVAVHKYFWLVLMTTVQLNTVARHERERERVRKPSVRPIATTFVEASAAS